MFTHADGSRGGRVLPSFVCFLHDILKIDAARITNHDIEMLHDESWKPICFAVRQSKVKVVNP